MTAKPSSATSDRTPRCLHMLRLCVYTILTTTCCSKKGTGIKSPIRSNTLRSYACVVCKSHSPSTFNPTSAASIITLDAEHTMAWRSCAIVVTAHFVTIFHVDLPQRYCHRDYFEYGAQKWLVKQPVKHALDLQWLGKLGVSDLQKSFSKSKALDTYHLE